MKRILFIFISIPLLLFGAASLVFAQETSDYSKLTTEDYTNISLPPLDLLFENAKGGPVYELATIEEQIERKLLTKEKKAVLGFINVRGSYQWGKFGSDYTFTDVSTPILYNYSTSKQKTYTVGAAVNIPLDDLFDLAPRVSNFRTGSKIRRIKTGDYRVVRDSNFTTQCTKTSCRIPRTCQCTIQHCRERLYQ